ncbi:MAG: hypothetical protein ACTTKZ_00820 [Bacteroides sp.]
MQENKYNKEILVAKLRSGDLSAEAACQLNELLEQLASEEENLCPGSLKVRLKSIPSNDVTNLGTNFEELCYEELEGTLSQQELEALYNQCAQHPQYARLHATILRTRCIAPLDIIYPNKERLKRHSVHLSFRWVGRVLSSAACLFLFVVLGGNLFDSTSEHDITSIHYKHELAQRYPTLSCITPATELHTDKTISTTPHLLKGDLTESSAIEEQQGVDNLLIHEPLERHSAFKPVRIDATQVLTYRAPQPELFQDWEQIALEDELLAFEEEMRELQNSKIKQEKDELTPLQTFLNFVYLQLAKR